PGELLRRLPEWDCYLLFHAAVDDPFEVPTPSGRSLVWGGAFVGLESDAQTGAAELQVLCDLYDPSDPATPGRLMPAAVRIDGTLTEGIEAQLARMHANAVADGFGDDNPIQAALHTALRSALDQVLPF